MTISIQFVVEDGTGKTDATSYVSVSEFEQYWYNRGVDYTSTSESTKKAWLNLATEFIDKNFKFWGYATEYDTQSLQFPRTGVRDSKNNLVDYNTIPTELKESVYRIAVEAKSTTDLYSKLEDGVSSKSMGPVSVSYRTGYKKVFQMASEMLKPFIKAHAALKVVS